MSAKNSSTQEEKNKPARDSEITCLEVPPDDSWFLEIIDDQENKLVFLIVRCTGMLPRRIGPFHDRQTALEIFDYLVNELEEVFHGGHWLERGEAAMVKRPFKRRWTVVTEDDELAQQAYPACASRVSQGVPKTPGRPIKKAV